jgi:hypothetical protein
MGLICMKNILRGPSGYMSRGGGMVLEEGVV